MEPNYIEHGTPGRTCAECKHFEADPKTGGLGKCFGYEVSATGSCNFFEIR
jgi:hypothetical protein